MLQAMGGSEKLDALLVMLSKYTILDLVRTGKLIMARGAEET
jgi:acetolactate synthase small subunit